MLEQIDHKLLFKKDYLWQSYLSKQLLIAAVDCVQDPDRLYIISASSIKNIECIRFTKGKCVIAILLKDDRCFYYPVYFATLLDALKIEIHINNICLGKLMPSITDWLIYFPHLSERFEVIDLA